MDHVSNKAYKETICSGMQVQIICGVSCLDWIATPWVRPNRYIQSCATVKWVLGCHLHATICRSVVVLPQNLASNFFILNLPIFWDISLCSSYVNDFSEEITIFRVENQSSKKPVYSRWLSSSSIPKDCNLRPPLSSSGQSSLLQIQRSWVRFQAVRFSEKWVWNGVHSALVTIIKELLGWKKNGSLSRK
jgi:hypothetical protein